MSASLILTFVSTLAFAIQLLIFAYLYSSHRVRFFHYLLWAWGAYTLSKGIKLLYVLLPGLPPLGLAIDVATVAAVGLTLAAAFAHRWDYRLRTRELLLGGGLAVLIAAASDAGDGTAAHLVGVGLGVTQAAAGILFWPS